MASKTTDVALITGFPGAGKTALLKQRLSRLPQDRKPFVLLCELGQAEMDSELPEFPEAARMILRQESSFCLCARTELVKALQRISEEIQPDVLFVEDAGVADPVSVEHSLDLPLYGVRYRLREHVCVLDAAHFPEMSESFPSLLRQAARAQRILLNKADLVPPETLDRIREIVGRDRPNPVFNEARHGITGESWETPEETPAVLKTGESGGERLFLEGEPLERYLTEWSVREASQCGPSDPLMCVTLEWEGEGLERLNSWIPMLPPDIVRAKGFLNDGAERRLFQYLRGSWTVHDVPRPVPEAPNRIVLIGAPQGVLPLHAWGELFGITVLA